MLIAILMLGLFAGETFGQSTDRVIQRWLRGRPPISAIVVEGNEFLKDSDIIKHMYSRRRSTWSTLKGDRRTRVQRESLGRDTLEIKYLYVTAGFLSVRLEETFELVEADSSVRVRVVIDEGRQLRYGARTVSGSYDKRFHTTLWGVANRLKEGKPINLFELRDASFEMKTVLANNGYPYATVEFTLDSGAVSRVTPVDFHIESDSLVHFGRIAVVGSERYPEKVVRRESRMHDGEVYRRKDIIDTQRRLIESGYFSTLNIAQVDESTNRYRPDFELRVRERKPMYTTFRTGVGRSDLADFEWDVSSAFGKRNFFGSRRYDLSTLAKFGVGDQRGLLEHSYRVRYTEPWFFKIRMPLVLTAEWSWRKDPDLDYKLRSWSLSASTIKKFSDEYQGEVGIEYESVRLYGVPEDKVQEIKDAEGISERRKLYLTFRRDSRDHIFVPRRGSLTDIAGEYFGGFLAGDDHFWKLEASWSSYQVVWPGWISATRFKSGWAQPFNGSDDVPIDDRFNLGGANTIRGFRVNSLGPVSVDGQPLKSDFYGLFNQEFRWQTIQVFQVVPVLKEFLGVWPLWQSLFFDMGNGFRDIDDFNLRDLAYSYGTGIQIVSPAGPIRIDYARRIKTEVITAGYRWHFTILYAF